MPFSRPSRPCRPAPRAILAVSGSPSSRIAFLLLRIAGAPSYTLLSSGLDPAQTGKVTAALDEQGIAYELRNNGTGLAVAKTPGRPGARGRSPAQGVSLDGGAGQGFELFDEQKLGASDFQQKVTYQRALEGEIARTIGGVQGVTQPAGPARAARGRPVRRRGQPGHGRGDARQLRRHDRARRDGAASPSSSPPPSRASRPTTSRSPTPRARSCGRRATARGAGGVAAGKQALEARYSRAMEADLNAMLVRTLGPGKAQVEVSADLNADKTTRDEVMYDKKGTPLKKSTETEKLKGGGTTTGGTAGTGSNIPTYSAGAAGSGSNSNYQRKTESTDFGVGKKVDRTEVAPGAVKKLNVALLVDKSVPAADFAAVQQAVSSAAGIDTARGDAMQAAQVPFAKVADAEGRPAADLAARPAQVGRHRHRDAAVPVLHEPPPEEARGRDARRPRRG